MKWVLDHPKVNTGDYCWSSWSGGDLLTSSRSIEMVQLMLSIPRLKFTINHKDKKGYTILSRFAVQNKNILPLLQMGATDLGDTGLDDILTGDNKVAYENHIKLMLLVRASQKKEITLSTDLIRQLRQYLYSV
jgi:hypothetical protein